MQKPRKSLQSKLFLAFVFIIVVSTGSIIYIWQDRTSEIIYDNVNKQFQNNLNNASAYFQELLDENENKSVSLIINEATKSILTDNFSNEYEKLQKVYEFENLCTNMLSKKSGLMGITLIDKKGQQYKVGRYNIYQNPFEESWYNETVDKAGKTHYFYYNINTYDQNYYEDGSFSFARAIMTNGELAGVIVFDISHSIFNEALIYVNENHNKVILLDSDDNEIYNLNTDSDEVKYITNAIGSETIVIDGINYLYLEPYVTKMWKMLLLVPVDLVLVEEKGLLKEIILIWLAILGLALILSMIISRSITSKITILKNAMTKVRQGNGLKVEMDIKSEDEIGVLANYFTDMMDDIDNLVEEIKTKEKQKRKLELKSLQSQIRPHFTYNTLNTIIYLSELNGSNNIEEVTRALIELLRAAAHNDDQLVTIAEELTYVKAYEKIQEYKYMGQFDIIYDVDEDVLEYKIIKFVLQPFVENCLIHGLSGKKKIQIKLSIYLDEDWIYFDIYDSGNGMSDKKILEAKNVTDVDDESIGIHNIIERLSCYYDDVYKFDIKSEIGKYTLVSMAIAKPKDDFDVEVNGND